MAKMKKVKISFHTIAKKMWGDQNNEEETPYWEVENILNYRINQPRKERFYDLKGDKFCFIESMSRHNIDDNNYLLSGYFKSARSEYRPDLIDKNTGSERPNPKTRSEGDIEKTHFVLKVSHTDNEVYLFFESNHSGININNFNNYLTDSAKKYLQSNGQEMRYSIHHYEIPRNNFLTELEQLSRSVLVEVYFDKQLLGSDALDFSNRTISLQRNLVLTARASKKESITEFGIDIWNKMHQSNSPISKLRIKGRDQNNNEVLLDTLLMCQTDFITVNKNLDTGDLNSIELLRNMKNIAISF